MLVISSSLCQRHERVVIIIKTQCFDQTCCSEIVSSCFSWRRLFCSCVCVGKHIHTCRLIPLPTACCKTDLSHILLRVRGTHCQLALHKRPSGVLSSASFYSSTITDTVQMTSMITAHFCRSHWEICSILCTAKKKHFATYCLLLHSN